MLYLTNTRVTGSRLKHINLSNLSVLNLSGTQVTDSELKELVTLQCLSMLYLAEHQSDRLWAEAHQPAQPFGT